MFPKFYDITIKKIKYNFIFCDTFRLLVFLRWNINYEKSLTKIMKLHRSKHFNILDFVIENYLYNEKNKKVQYLIIFNDNEILSISRLIFKNKLGYINAVHTNIDFRRKKLCFRNITKLIKLGNKLFDINKFELDVDVDNIPAIKCYKKCGFKIYKKTIDKYGESFRMIKKISTK